MNAPTMDARTMDAPNAPTIEAATDAPGIDAPLAPDAQADAGPEATTATPAFLTKLDKAQGQLTEGLWEVSPSAVEGIGTNGTPIMSYVVFGKVVAVAGDGGTTDFGVAGDGGGQATYTLGITTDATGSVYVGVAAGGAPPNAPAPGIWKFPPTGGAGSVFSAASAVTPAMGFANGLDFIGADLFVADSEGRVYKINAAGTAAVWSSDPLLAPDKTACGGMVPLPIGANGIVHDTNNVYVTNTNFGRLIKIPIAADGSAGTPAVIKEDCATLVGADGLVIDPKDGTFIVALNVQNSLVRVTQTGAVTVLASGSPLASPASVLIDTTGNQRRLLVTNSTFFTAADAGSPGLLALPIP
jgi:sugar lactone lactonase YvrE